MGRGLIHTTLTGTHYEPALCLIGSHTTLASSTECNVKKLLKCAKKMPTYVLMAAIVEGRLLDRTQLDRYANLPDLETMRAQFCATLSVASSISNQLLYHPNLLLKQLTHLAGSQDASSSAESGVIDSGAASDSSSSSSDSDVEGKADKGEGEDSSSSSSDSDSDNEKPKAA